MWAQAIRHLPRWIVFAVIAFTLPSGAHESWSAQGSYTVEVKDRSGQQTSSFQYKESHALIVGISDYNNGWFRLPGVKTDIREVRHILEKRGFHVVVAEDLEQAEFEQTYRDFILRYGLDPENRLLFYFAGHGYTIRPPQARDDPAAWLGVLVARDAPLPGPEPLAEFRSHVLSIERFASMAREMSANHAMFIFDSCFSGARGFAISLPSPDELTKGITRQTGAPVRQFISSGTADQLVPDTSEFRRQFVAALNGEADWNNDGYVTGSELGFFLHEKVSQYSQQTPQYGKIYDSLLDKGDFVFPLSTPAFSCTPMPSPIELKPAIRNSIGMEFALIPGAEFTMGVNDTPAMSPAHQVTVSQPFYLGKYEVTQAQWTALMDKNPSQFTGDPNLPVENVSWTEVQEFIRKLNAREGTTRYRLPTEAEWELAARCTKSGTSFGDDSSQRQRYAWYDANADGRTHAVGQLTTNDWGVYDILGNVWEWTADWYADYGKGSVIDPQGPAQGSFRVYRGCGWERGVSPLPCHSTNRYGARPNFRHPSLGFRVVLTTLPEKS
ncbi:MAG: SUMF1/EgtB/PvdO family nonheme iron enzyme [Candidatus Binatia bacterium]